jgi:transposase-like protein
LGMGDFARKADGRRVFTAEFKRTAVARVQSGETTVPAIRPRRCAGRCG